jgi:hypothetical protein
VTGSFSGVLKKLLIAAAYNTRHNKKSIVPIIKLIQ